MSVKKRMMPAGLIKTEPGLSHETVIKTEPGLISSGRLSSFKLPRDLTLGGQSARKVQKKIYTPNLGAIRNNKNISDVQSSRDSTRGRIRGRGQFDQGKRGRGGRGASNLVQTAGVFSEGGALTLKRHSTSTGYAGSNNTDVVMQKPRLKKELKIDKEEENEQLRSILQHYDDEPDIVMDTECMPIILPMADREKMLQVKKGGRAVLNGSAISEIGKLKHAIKSELAEDKFEVKKSKMEPGQYGDVGASTLVEESVDSKKIKSDYKYLPSASTLNSVFAKHETPLMLLQLPDTLPGHGPEVTPETSKKSEPAISSEDQKKNLLSSPMENFCTLEQLEEGKIGEVLLYGSGKARLVLGNTSFDLAIGTHSTFLQEIMSVSVNKEERSGQIINLGPVEAKLIATPDWESMLATR